VISAPLPILDTLDSEALKKMVVAQHHQLLEQQQQASQLMESASHQLESASRKIEHLKLVIEKYKRMLFGTKSEKLKGELEQLEFQMEELKPEQAARAAQQPHSPRATNNPRPQSMVCCFTAAAVQPEAGLFLRGLIFDG
jgi:transposase